MVISLLCMLKVIVIVGVWLIRKDAKRAAKLMEVNTKLMSLLQEKAVREREITKRSEKESRMYWWKKRIKAKILVYKAEANLDRINRVSGDLVPSQKPTKG